MKELIWVGSSRKDLQQAPEAVRLVMGYALYLAQVGGRHPDLDLIRTRLQRAEEDYARRKQAVDTAAVVL